MLTACGVPAGLPRFGSSVVGTGTWLDVKAAGVAVTAATSVLLALILAALRQPIGTLILHQPLGLAPALLLSVALVFAAQSPVQTAILKTQQDLRSLVLADSITAVEASAATIIMISVFKASKPIALTRGEIQGRDGSTSTTVGRWCNRQHADCRLRASVAKGPDLSHPQF